MHFFKTMFEKIDKQKSQNHKDIGSNVNMKMDNIQLERLYIRMHES